MVSACGPSVHLGAGVVAYSTYTPPYTFPTPTQEVAPPTAIPCTGVVTAQPRLNVRAEPHRWAQWRGFVDEGATVAVLETRGEWLRIQNPAGWVAGRWVALGVGC
jgi:hypothetical protein